jgi:hypothetical protein
MLNSTEAQIEMSASLLHSFGKVIGYLTKVSNAMEEGTLKANTRNCINLIEQYEKAEIITLRNWCKHDGK